MSRKRPTDPKAGAASWPPDREQLASLLEDAIVDAHGDSEQCIGFYTMLDEHLALPFQTRILGVLVTVQRIDVSDEDEIVAICRRGTHKQVIPLLHLPLPTPKPAGAEWIEAYRYWARGK